MTILTTETILLLMIAAMSVALIILSVKVNKSRGKMLITRIAILISVLMLIATLVRGGFIASDMYKEYKYELFIKEKTAFYEELVELHENDLNVEIEYGEEVVLVDLEGLEYTEVAQELTGPGDYVIVRNAIDTDGFELQVTHNVTIVDTQYPVIDGTYAYEVVEGTKFNASNLKVTAEDPVDGSLDVSITGDYDTDTPGTYTFIAYAEDKHGNKTEQEITLKVNKRPVVVKSTHKPAAGNKAPASGGSANKPAIGGNYRPGMKYSGQAVQEEIFWYVLNSLPSNVTRFFSGVTFYDQIPGQGPNIGGTANQKTGAIRIRNGLRDDVLVSVAVHEIGHTWCYANRACYTDEWVVIFEEEWQSAGHYGSTNMAEAFSATMESYYAQRFGSDANQYRPKSHIPRSIQYVEKLLQAGA